MTTQPETPEQHQPDCSDDTLQIVRFFTDSGFAVTDYAEIRRNLCWIEFAGDYHEAMGAVVIATAQDYTIHSLHQILITKDPETNKPYWVDKPYWQITISDSYEDDESCDEPE